MKERMFLILNMSKTCEVLHRSRIYLLCQEKVWLYVDSNKFYEAREVI